MDRDELYYYLNRLSIKAEILSSLLESAMESEGLTRIDAYEIEDIYNVLYGPMDRAISDLEVLLLENSQRFRDEY